MDIIKKAKEFAYKAHNEINQTYASIYPYTYHLDLAVEVGYEFLYLIEKKEHSEVIAGIYLHDTLEDTLYTYNDLKKVVGLVPAEYSYALWNNKGRNRDERADFAYYSGIRDYKHATFIKLCDRIANIRYGESTGSSMFKKYKKEHDHFKASLYDGRYKEMWGYIEHIFNEN